MARIMDAAAVRDIRDCMDVARTSKPARKAMAKAALTRDNLTASGRAEWEKELR